MDIIGIAILVYGVAILSCFAASIVAFRKGDNYKIPLIVGLILLLIVGIPLLLLFALCSG